MNKLQIKPCPCAIFICHITTAFAGGQKKKKRAFLPFCIINISLPLLSDYSFACGPVIISKGGLVIAFLHPVVCQEYFQGTEHLSLFTVMRQQ